jgi:hypothetical protein
MNWIADSTRPQSGGASGNDRAIRAVAWLIDPASMPPPTFPDSTRMTPSYCGYLAWHRGADGKFRIIGEEENFIDNGTIAKMATTPQ